MELMEWLTSNIDKIDGKDLLLLLIGATLPVFGYGIKKVRKYFVEGKRLEALLGEWHTYHWSRRNFESVFRYERWRVENTIGGARIITIDETKRQLKYRGKITLESTYAVIAFTGDLHGENWTVRATAPIPSDDTMMFCLFVGEDFDHENYAGLMIACRNERNLQEAQNLLSRVCDISSDEQAIRIKKGVQQWPAA